MSFQVQQQQQPQAQPQQPVQVYPKTVTNQPSPHHSNGSFGTVFIVLAIILVISVVACFLGRLCNRRYNKNNDNNQSRQHNSLQRRPANPNRQQQIHDFETREEDIEFGVDKRMPPPIITRPRGLAFEPPAGTRSQPHGNINNGHNQMKDFEMKSDHESDHHRAGL
ncbi:unnamed protein product [Trifolium pratense]|uniref:Uncharacterized protein n=1 Tax=Trifolium pratense TaxID=57577 RepID=A0ACB0IXD5_TRIPR|nr:unnamed protein product [Trifolium pratense]